MSNIYSLDDYRRRKREKDFTKALVKPVVPPPPPAAGKVFLDKLIKDSAQHVEQLRKQAEERRIRNEQVKNQLKLKGDK